jgi:hypothetical protein
MKKPKDLIEMIALENIYFTDILDKNYKIFKRIKLSDSEFLMCKN